MNYSSVLLESLKRHAAAIESLQREELLKLFQEAASWILEALQKGKKILVAGNGGSAADAQHFAAEFICKYKDDRRPLPCLALTTDTSILTSVGNDYQFEDIFVRQVQALGSEGDIFVGISTSGNSKNILLAIEAAKQKRMKVIGLTGGTGGRMKESTPLLLSVDSTETARIQEGHMILLHNLCQIVDSQLA